MFRIFKFQRINQSWPGDRIYSLRKRRKKICKTVILDQTARRLAKSRQREFKVERCHETRSSLRMKLHSFRLQGEPFWYTKTLKSGVIQWKFPHWWLIWIRKFDFWLSYGLLKRLILVNIWVPASKREREREREICFMDNKKRLGISNPRQVKFKS